MARWEPGARDRLITASVQLFREQGYDRTTVAQIAAAAGMTERTFFRHFPDKREVLFDGGTRMQNLVSASIAEASSGDEAWTVAIDALRAMCAQMFADRLDGARTRQQILDSSPELQERELLKLESLTSAITVDLRARGSDDRAALLVARVAVAVFVTSFGQWITSGGSLAGIVTDTADALRRHVAPPS